MWNPARAAVGAGLRLWVGDTKIPAGLVGTRQGHEEVQGLTCPPYLSSWYLPGVL